MHSADVPVELNSALEYAVSRRDAGILAMVRRAIEYREVLLAFQPVVQAQAPDKIAFYEGLVRVLDETGRVIPAREFIHAVETTELGRQLDCIALQKGLAELRREPSLRLSINMSARSIGYSKWREALEQGLNADPTVGERLILEVTEHSAITVPELLVDFMHATQGRGVSFAIDDFGSGYTALRHFKDFYFDLLKIDGQFTRDIARDPDNQVLVAAIVSIADQFDMFTVAESVESHEDAIVLRELGLTCLQGFHCGAPKVTPPWRESVALQTA